MSLELEIPHDFSGLYASPEHDLIQRFEKCVRAKLQDIKIRADGEPYIIYTFWDERNKIKYRITNLEKICGDIQ